MIDYHIVHVFPVQIKLHRETYKLLISRKIRFAEDYGCKGKERHQAVKGQSEHLGERAVQT